MFTTSLSNYDSLYDDCIFSFSDSSDGADEQDRTVQIVESTLNKTLSVKKFYSTASYDINVAHIVRPLCYPTLSSSDTGFAGFTEIESGAMWVHLLDDEGNQSSSVLLSHAKSGGAESGLRTTMPTERVIALGERDVIRIVAECDQQIVARQNQYAYGIDEVAATYGYIGAADDKGYATFFVKMEELAAFAASSPEPVLDSVEIIFTIDGDEVARVDYTVIDPVGESVTLAWYTACGSVEHYTFPNIVESRLSNEGVRYYKLKSAPESDAIRAAMEEIITSERVWRATESGYSEVSVVSESLDTTACGVLATVQIEIEQ